MSRAIYGIGRRVEELDEGATEGTTGRPILTGWDAIEDYMRRFDHGAVKDFTDDIDTMLVFAGLFSASLTAFLAQTYQGLLPDSSQLTVDLLAGIYSQLSGVQISSAYNPNFITNSTSSGFHPSTSTIAINLLWFLSLIFSLSAALFGLLVKQWIREYMKWHNVLAPPRENVLIRQLRREEWERWKVAAIIYSIPALLEIGVILFFSGMIIFVWSLERTVAIAVTSAIGFFLLVVVVFTLLPVISRHCPYKTPTGWAFVYLSRSIGRILRQLGRFSSSLAKLSQYERLDWDTILQPAEHWRDRDRYLIDSEALTKQDSEYVKKAQLRDSVRDAVCLNVHEFHIINRAFSWVLRGTDSEQLHRNIFQCLQSVHHYRGLDDAGYNAMQYHSTMTILHEDRISNAIWTDEEHPILPIQVGQTTAYIPTWACLSSSYSFVLTSTLLYSSKEKMGQAQSQIMYRLVLQELQLLLERWEVALQTESNPTPSRTRFPEDLDRLTRRTMQMAMNFFRLQAGFRLDERSFRDLSADFMGLLIDVYNRIIYLDAAHCSGGVAVIIEILCMLGHVTLDPNGILNVELDHSRTRYPLTPLTLRRLEKLTAYFHGLSDAASYFTVLFLTDFVLRALSGAWELSQAEVHAVISNPLLTRIEEAVERSISQDSLKIDYIVASWIKKIAAALELGSWIDSHSSYRLVKLLSALEINTRITQTLEADIARCFDKLSGPAGLDTVSSGRLPTGWQWRINSSGEIYYRTTVPFVRVWLNTELPPIEFIDGAFMENGPISPPEGIKFNKRSVKGLTKELNALHPSYPWKDHSSWLDCALESMFAAIIRNPASFIERFEKTLPFSWLYKLYEVYNRRYQTLLNMSGHSYQTVEELGSQRDSFRDALEEQRSPVAPSGSTPSARDVFSWLPDFLLTDEATDTNGDFVRMYFMGYSVTYRSLPVQARSVQDGPDVNLDPSDTPSNNPPILPISQRHLVYEPDDQYPYETYGQDIASWFKYLFKPEGIAFTATFMVSIPIMLVLQLPDSDAQRWGVPAEFFLLDHGECNEEIKFCLVARILHNSAKQHFIARLHQRDPITRIFAYDGMQDNGYAQDIDGAHMDTHLAGRDVDLLGIPSGYQTTTVVYHLEGGTSAQRAFFLYQKDRLARTRGIFLSADTLEEVARMEVTPDSQHRRNVTLPVIRPRRRRNLQGDPPLQDYHYGVNTPIAAMTSPAPPDYDPTPDPAAAHYLDLNHNVVSPGESSRLPTIPEDYVPASAENETPVVEPTVEQEPAIGPVHGSSQAEDHLEAASVNGVVDDAMFDPIDETGNTNSVEVDLDPDTSPVDASLTESQRAE